MRIDLNRDGFLEGEETFINLATRIEHRPRRFRGRSVRRPAPARMRGAETVESV
jgi:hypothetical protein